MNKEKLIRRLLFEWFGRCEFHQWSDYVFLTGSSMLYTTLDFCGYTAEKIYDIELRKEDKTDRTKFIFSEIVSVDKELEVIYQYLIN